MTDTFTNQKRRVATEADTKAPWAGAKAGVRFRCCLCGHKFAVGDGWRWVYVTNCVELEGKKHGLPNFLTCDACDGDDVIERWIERHREFYSDRFWALR